MHQLIAVVTSIVLAGCSFAFVRGPDKRAPANIYPDCTSNKTWPIIDAVVGGVFALAALSALQREDGGSMTTPGVNVDNDSDLSPKAAAAVSLAVAAGAGIGAFVGFRRVGTCRASRETFRAAYPNGAPTLYPPVQGQYPQQQGYPPPQQQGYPPPQQPAGPPPGSTPAPLPQGWVPTPMPAGYEGGACFANNVCAQGLVCASGLCARPSPAPAGTTP